MIAAPRMTLDEFLEWQELPENSDRQFELVKGEVVEMSRPSFEHGEICGRVFRLLDDYLERRGEGSIATNDTGVLLDLDPPTLRGPDVVLFAETLSDEAKKASSLKSRIPTTLVVEVISPTDRVKAVHEKAREYLNAGISLVWVIDPDNKTAVVFKRGAEDCTAALKDTLDGNGILPDLSIPVTEIFRVRRKS